MEVKVKVETNIPVKLIQKFADEVGRKRSQVDRAVSDGLLDYGFVFGMKCVIMNMKSDSYRSLCEALDEVKQQNKKMKRKK